jgi:hypothetical protein
LSSAIEKKIKKFKKILSVKNLILLGGFCESRGNLWTPNNERLFRNRLQSYPSIESLPGIKGVFRIF